MSEQRIGVVGAGTMGQGIAQVVAASGFNVRLYDVADEQLTRAKNAIDKGLEKLVAKEKMTKRLQDEAPQSIGGEKVVEVSVQDGVKYILADDSWLLIRPSGTEPVLRVYAEGRSEGMMKALLNYGEEIAASIA